MNPIRHLSLLLVPLAVTSCTTLQPLHSKPPFAKIILPKPYNGEGFMFHVTMPAGTYLPISEEGTTYYYEAPSNLSLHTLATESLDGGFYVDARTKTLTGWWYIDSDGNKNNGALGTPLPDYKAVP